MTDQTDTDQLTAAEKQFLLRLLAQLQLSPLADGAAETVATVRAIAMKLAPGAEG
jgi:hypothetical protein